MTGPRGGIRMLRFILVLELVLQLSGLVTMSAYRIPLGLGLMLTGCAVLTLYVLHSRRRLRGPSPLP
ncbi:hypothetical protein [Streptomyces sp. CMB-StM0423]|uniref:hypothetical protein n=1 Tax=Streptomyces sp. CMB-StM0423 TaxID=2059884 RepID=UPI000C7018FA|nr:hypothetical protein [Streptomyces sp. CMB-StM0423]AUH40564.1 hypothetical protein CXR04_10170 [Streptomyces sp. CMB-StM0423]